MQRKGRRKKKVGGGNGSNKWGEGGGGGDFIKEKRSRMVNYEGGIYGFMVRKREKKGIKRRVWRACIHHKDIEKRLMDSGE